MTKTFRKIRAGAWFAGLIALTGCSPLPIAGRFKGEAKVDADARVVAEAAVRGSVEVKIATAPDPGPMAAVVVRGSHGGPGGPPGSP